MPKVITKTGTGKGFQISHYICPIWQKAEEAWQSAFLILSLGQQ